MAAFGSLYKTRHVTLTMCFCIYVNDLLINFAFKTFANTLNSQTTLLNISRLLCRFRIIESQIFQLMTAMKIENVEMEMEIKSNA